MAKQGVAWCNPRRKVIVLDKWCNPKCQWYCEGCPYKKESSTTVDNP